MTFLNTAGIRTLDSLMVRQMPSQLTQRPSDGKESFGGVYIHTNFTLQIRLAGNTDHCLRTRTPPADCAASPPRPARRRRRRIHRAARGRGWCTADPIWTGQGRFRTSLRPCYLCGPEPAVQVGFPAALAAQAGIAPGVAAQIAPRLERRAAGRVGLRARREGRS